MEEVRIIRNEPVDAIELNNLFKTHNWYVDPVDRLEKSIKNSWGWIAARNSDHTLIGFVQVISDGIRHAYILKMIVHPDFRKKGIGSRIMTELINLLNENDLVPTLVATPGNENFYKNFGFETQSNGFTAMCIRKN